MPQNLSPGFGREGSQNAFQQHRAKQKLPSGMAPTPYHFTVLTRSTRTQRGSCPMFLPSFLCSSKNRSRQHTVCGTCCSVRDFTRGTGMRGAGLSELVRHRTMSLWPKAEHLLQRTPASCLHSDVTLPDCHSSPGQHASHMATPERAIGI